MKYILDEGKPRRWSVDPLEMLLGPITRARAKRFKGALIGLIQEVLEDEHMWHDKDEPRLIHIIGVDQVQSSKECIVGLKKRKAADLEVKAIGFKVHTAGL